MGIFDLASPALSWVDWTLSAFLPAVLRLLVWAVLGAAASMLLYAWLSPQQRISAVKTQAAASRAMLARYDDEFAGLWALIGRTLGLSAKHLGLTLGPAVAASLPLLFLLVWLSNTYSFQDPTPGIPVQVTTKPEGVAISFSPEIASVHAMSVWSLPWPAPGESVALVDQAGVPLTVLPSTALVPTIHKREWWNLLVGNPAGYLPDSTPVDKISIGLSQAQYLGIGPAWARSWEAPFFAMMIVAAIFFKLWWRIH